MAWLLVLVLASRAYLAQQVFGHQRRTSRSSNFNRLRYGTAARDSAALKTQWNTDLVIVVAAHNEYNLTSLPEWMQNDTEATYYVYQRTDPTAPHYSPNFAFEGGVFIQFIFDHYHDLPRRTAFIHSYPNHHNPKWRDWLRCVREDTAWASLNGLFVKDRGTRMWKGMDALVEQCWKNLLSAFGVRYLVSAGEEPRVSFYCCAQFVLSRAQILSKPHDAYAAAHRLFAGGDGRCHHGRVNWTDLSTSRRCEDIRKKCTRCHQGPATLPNSSHELHADGKGWDGEDHYRGSGWERLGLEGSRHGGEPCFPNGLNWTSGRHARRWSHDEDCYIMENELCKQEFALDSINLTKHTSAGALEHLQHVVLGGQPLNIKNFDMCSTFKPRSSCAGSPCVL